MLTCLDVVQQRGLVGGGNIINSLHRKSLRALLNKFTLSHDEMMLLTGNITIHQNKS